MTACLQGPGGQPEQLGRKVPASLWRGFFTHSSKSYARVGIGHCIPRKISYISLISASVGLEAAGLPLAPTATTSRSPMLCLEEEDGACLGSFLTLPVALVLLF